MLSSRPRERSPERRRIKKERDDPDSEKKDRHRTSSHRKPSTKNKSSSRTSISPHDPKRRPSMPPAKEASVVDLPKSDSKTSLPYPTFSKAHSKEAVRLSAPADILSPPATDFGASKDKLPGVRSGPTYKPPPSPPLTDDTNARVKSTSAKNASVETIRDEDSNIGRDSKFKIRLQPKGANSGAHLRSTSEVGARESPKNEFIKQGTPLKNDANSRKPQRSVSQPNHTLEPESLPKPAEVETEISSDGTSIAPEQLHIQRPGSRVPAAAAPDVLSQIRSPPPQHVSRQQTPIDIFVDEQSPAVSATPFSTTGPPPPPPPPAVPVIIPRVDYLLQHGGLNQNVPKNLILAGKPMAIQQAAMSPGQPPAIVAHLFEPYNQLLDDFGKVMNKNGSLAVATGYRSVARRLLDRLEAVFARDISSEYCQCNMCQQDRDQDEDQRGISWGEILELVSGRKDLPTWPPFSFVTSPVGLGIELEINAPMQKLDIDVPEEYREHYIRQSRKTKTAVDRWLNRQGGDVNNANHNLPADVDDETLMFAILTHLPADHRSLFKDLLGVVDRPTEPPRRAPTPDRNGPPKPTPTPQPRPRQEYIIIAGMAIQRLYRLSQPPRDPETALFMVNNITLHNALATLAAVSNDEWDILISGRFDGFLRSGAEDLAEAGRHTPYSRPGTRDSMSGYQPTHLRKPSHPSRTTTPAHVPATSGAPIAFDEETEIATLAEIERDIYQGMEVLEDAFEALHLKAESVRRALRERSAGLAAAAQRRRGPFDGTDIEVRMGTPASGINALNGLGDGQRWEAETDDELGDWEGISELAPDDSASNISSSRRRRPKRRNERRTPVVIDEEDEDFVESEGTSSPRKI